MFANLIVKLSYHLLPFSPLIVFQLYIEETEDYLRSLNLKFDTPLRGKAITYQTNGFLSIVLEFLNIIRDC